MLIQCPKCQTKMKPKVADDVTDGTRLKLHCRCGTWLRFTVRRAIAPTPAPPPKNPADAVLEAFQRVRATLDQNLRKP